MGTRGEVDDSGAIFAGHESTTDIVCAECGDTFVEVDSDDSDADPYAIDRFVVTLDNLDGGECATVHVEGAGALAWAKHQQSIGGSRWEGADGADFAHTMVVDSPSLVAELKAEGYVLNEDAYSAPGIFDAAAE